MPTDKFFGNELDIIKDKVNSTIDGLKKQYGLSSGNPWPQTKYEPITTSGGLNLYPKHKTRGFLPPVNITPNANSGEFGTEIKTYGQYTYKDWRGQELSLNNLGILNTGNRFNESQNIPKSSSELLNYPYSTRDTYLIHGDTSTDYFKHGLQVIDYLTPIENPENGKSNLRLDSFKYTPFEKNDPIMYGFEIIMDDIASPLLNGSISDFLRNYSNISEIAARIPVYEDFKQQFVKFFKTNATVRINESGVNITKMRESGYPESGNDKGISQTGKKSYLSYYLKKIDGLNNLIEQNTPEQKKYLVDYNKDKITLSFSEDVSLSVGTLAHLYKLLYWSRPNGKSMIPENLLRFNCDIIVSEVRNFNRVKKALDTGNIEVIKDNVSRHIYSLKECQFYFNSMPHESSIDMGNIAVFGEGSYAVQFDYKYSTSKLERFAPTSDGFGQYVGYDGGAIWKIGNPGAREARGTQSSVDYSLPSFFTVGDNSLSQNGVVNPFVMSIPQDNLYKRVYVESNEDQSAAQQSSNGFQNFKVNSIAKAKELKDGLINTAINSATRELQSQVNIMTALLNKSLNKVLNASGVTGVRPPRNVYTESAQNAGQRIFYDVRGDLLNFVGNTLGNQIGGGFRGTV